MKRWPSVRAPLTGLVISFSAAIASPLSVGLLSKGHAPQEWPVQATNIFNAEGQDPREAVDFTRERVLRPIVQISGSTAFLVSPCHALAAYHGVFGLKTAEPPLPLVTVHVPDEGYEGPPSFKAVTATPVLWGAGYIQSAIREDWVLLRLSSCEGRRIGWLELVPEEDKASRGGISVTMAGYPNDKPKTHLWRDRTGHISSEGSQMLRDCLLNSAATSGGNSGSPLFHEAGAVVLGMQVRVLNWSSRIIQTYDERQANVALDIRPIHRKISATILADKHAFWAERPDLMGRNPAHL